MTCSHDSGKKLCSEVHKENNAIRHIFILIEGLQITDKCFRAARELINPFFSLSWLCVMSFPSSSLDPDETREKLLIKSSASIIITHSQQLTQLEAVRRSREIN